MVTAKDERIKVNKPWGYELWFAKTDKYVGKIIFVKKGNRLSLQYHKEKDETMYVLSGIAQVVLDQEYRRVVTGDIIHIPPLVKHRIEALTDITIIEVSTPEVEDVVRIEDDYGRG